MGENDGSSGAAPSAQSDIDTDLGVQTGGFFARVIGALSPSEATVEEEAPTNPRPQAHGMINLRRMRVEDVAAYETFLMNHVLGNPVVASAASAFTLRRLKYTTAVPL